MRSRPNQIKFYLNDTELKALKTLLNGFEGSRAEFIRKSILNANTTHLNAFNDGLKELIRQYKAVGNNINQLTRAVHQGKCIVETAELQALRKELERIWQLLKLLRVGEP